MNFIIIHKTGAKQYTTSATAYKVVKNQPVYIGEAHQLPESNALDYLTHCLINAPKYAKKVQKITDEYRKGKHNIYKL